ncbi:MAG: hypothetical protein S4CHLAM6_05590 [Chlamydiae bacterium]|nr:hypothetical protein [Chlamydiota bacterium]
MHMLINKRLLINTAKCLMAMLVASFVFSTPVSANVTDNENALLAYSNKNKRSGKSSTDYQAVNSWTPYFTWIGNVQDQNMTMFTQFNVGVGFLYFSKVRGNFNTIPTLVNGVNANTFIPFKGDINYNRTPVFQYSVGYRIYNWFKVSLALEHQNGVNIQTDALPGIALTGRVSNATVPTAQFRASLGLNAIFPKLTFELPWPMIWKNWLNALYLSAGVGPCWQSWTDVRVFDQYTAASLQTSFVNTLNQKYPASAFWQIDSGIRSKMATPNSNISFLLGCRFSSWGQIRNVGQLDQQGRWNFGLAKPFRAKMLYSFVPYIGMQWNF